MKTRRRRRRRRRPRGSIAVPGPAASSPGRAVQAARLHAVVPDWSGLIGIGFRLRERLVAERFWWCFLLLLLRLCFFLMGRDRSIDGLLKLKSEEKELLLLLLLIKTNTNIG